MPLVLEIRSPFVSAQLKPWTSDVRSGLAFAHVQKGEAAGFLSGLKHPVSGPDQVLAMVAVGLSALNSTLRKFIAYPTRFR